MSDFCEIHKPEYFCSTNLNSKIDSYNRLAKRILWQLGVPSINVEIARDAIYENISIAAEYFTTYAGQTDEYLVFSSDLYERHKGIRLDHLFSVRDTISTNISSNYSNNLYNPNTKQYYNLGIKNQSGKETITINTLSSINTDVKNEMFNPDTQQYYNLEVRGNLGEESLNINQLNNISAYDNKLYNPDTQQYYNLTIDGLSGEEYINLYSTGDINVQDNKSKSIIRDTDISDTSFNADIKTPEYVYVCIKNIPFDYISHISTLSGYYKEGINEGQIIPNNVYNILVNPNTGGSLVFETYFEQSYRGNFSIKGVSNKPIEQYNNSFDYDIMDYRKVNAVVDLNMGESSGINTLFTIEQTLAQQTYFSYAMGNYGFDLISWYVLKDWLDTRQKLLSIDPTYTFNNRTQMLTLFPEPSNTKYWAVLHCLVERPLKDILKEMWVQRYALALTKIEIAHIRGRFGNLSLFGGGSLNYSDLMSQGVKEKEDLERDLLEGATPGLGSMRPAQFFIG